MVTRLKTIPPIELWTLKILWRRLNFRRIKAYESLWIIFQLFPADFNRVFNPQWLLNELEFVVEIEIGSWIYLKSLISNFNAQAFLLIIFSNQKSTLWVID